MAGHPLINQVAENKEAITIDGIVYCVHITWHRMPGVDGYLVGLKFSDAGGSMDSAKIGSANPYKLADAVRIRAAQILMRDLANISIFGFYLLTDDLENRRSGSAKIKRKFYHTGATFIHESVKHKLQYLTSFDVQGGMGWVMSENQIETYENFGLFENELSKPLRITNHVN